jgi:hypothetical protein
MEKGVHEGHEVRKARLLCHTPQHDRPRNGIKVSRLPPLGVF